MRVFCTKDRKTWCQACTALLQCLSRETYLFCCFNKSFVLRHPCPFPRFRPVPPVESSPRGGTTFISDAIMLVHIMQNNCNASFYSMCRAPKKNFMSVIHVFLKNLYFFKIEKFQFLRKMEDFCLFDALNFLKVKSGEKDKNVSKRLDQCHVSHSIGRMLCIERFSPKFKM